MCYSYQPLTEKLIITRKNHRCEWCSETVYKGESAHYRSYVFDREFTSGYMHTECHDAMNDSDSKAICDGWMPGDFERGVSAKYGEYF